MSDDDLIRRGDAKRIFGGSVFGQAIARCLDGVPAAPVRDVAALVKPLEWATLGASFTAEDPLFKVVAVTSDPNAYDAERAARILGSLVAAPVPDGAALVEAAKCMSDAYDHWANQASGTPSDIIAAASLYSRSIALRAALSAWEAAQK